MNIPYVKQFDENGVITNPIIGKYVNEYENRAERKKFKQKQRFYGESKNHHLTVVKSVKYRRVKQIIECKDKKGKLTGEIRVIEHYLLSTV